MSVDIHPVEHQPDLERPPTRRLRLVLTGSIAAGILSALVLTLVVFPGGTESTITGSFLVAFGFGWALIAVLSSRNTATPQRWAALPATILTVTGLGLAFLAPGGAALTTLNWVWPPLMAALAVWMHRRIRQNLPGAGRWLLIPVVVVLGASAVGATYGNVTALRDRSYAAPGTLYDVGGHRLHLECQGQSSPTVVLFNGLGETAASWTRIAGGVATTTRVCAYDRVGQGWSDDSDNPQDAVAAADDLHGLLAEAGETGPFVLVGHSIGGPYAMTYAAHHPDAVAGLVLLDSSSPEQFTAIPSYPLQYALMRRGLALLPTLDRLGLGDVRAARNGRDELSMLPEVFAQAQALTTLHGLPVDVLTASETLQTPGWEQAQDELASLSTNSLHRTVESSHAGLVDDERGAAASLQAITEVITAVRTGDSVATP